MNVPPLSIIFWSKKRWVTLTNSVTSNGVTHFHLIVSETGDVVEQVDIRIKYFRFKSVHLGGSHRMPVNHFEYFNARPKGCTHLQFRPKTYLGLIRRKEHTMAMDEILSPKVGDIVEIDTTHAFRFGNLRWSYQEMHGLVGEIKSFDGDVANIYFGEGYAKMKIDECSMSINGLYHPSSSRALYVRETIAFNRYISSPFSSFCNGLQGCGIINFNKLRTGLATPRAERMDLFESVLEMKKQSAAFFASHSYFPKCIFTLSRKLSC